MCEVTCLVDTGKDFSKLLALSRWVGDWCGHHGFRHLEWCGVRSWELVSDEMLFDV